MEKFGSTEKITKYTFGQATVDAPLLPTKCISHGGTVDI